MFTSVLKTKVTSLVEETVKVGVLVPQNLGLCSEGLGLRRWNNTKTLFSSFTTSLYVCICLSVFKEARIYSSHLFNICHNKAIYMP